MMGLLYRAADAVRRRKLRGDSGRLGEDLAHRYLRCRGCTIVARNYRPRGGAGEIDLVAWHAERLVFVEVKTRLSADFGEPASAVDSEKRERLQHAARDYARRADIAWARTRFDIVSIVLEPTVRIDWLPDAF
ncbi:MAG TPA: YraN family protein [Candidatus Sulfopaludibacter sp.]|jgi:putative endonuclease|nr:YraN family protein [Candidatus Sulfopaludibacter sp.]